ncbi:MAG: 3-oxoacyl-[acyl-carrier-protein] synthase III C-terminal domain-containing protein [Cyanobacteria bacterium J06639_18]
MNYSTGIRSLAVCFPEIISTRDDWFKQFPQLSNKVSQRKARRSKVAIASRIPKGDIANSNNSELDIWSQEVVPYLSDPFRGNLEHRVLNSEQSSLMLEYGAGKEALEAAKLAPEEVGLLIVASFDPGRIGHGNACYLAEKLGLRCPAWNLESTCSGALIALQNANALLQTGVYGNVLVVVSHVGSKNVDKKDTLSLSMGDAAGAFVVGSCKANQGVLGTKIINTTATLGAYAYEQIINSQGELQVLTRTGENASALAETAVDFVRICCEGALANAGVTLEEIKFFAFNTPTAWYARVCSRALGIDPERTINLYPCYGNIGPVFAIANLYHAAQSGKIRENDLVLVYTNGASATATATVMRWGDVALGLPPAAPLDVTLQQKQVHFTEKTISSIAQTVSSRESYLFKEEFLSVNQEKRREILENYLIEVLSQLLEVSVFEINPQQSLMYLIDSLIALEFKRRIDKSLQLLIPMEKFFQHKNIAQITDYLLERLAIKDIKLFSSKSVRDSNEVEELIII